MPNVSWLIRRLKAMSVQEVAWRVSQKALEKQERAAFSGQRRAVTEAVFNRRLAALRPDGARFALNREASGLPLHTAIPLLDNAEYEAYKTRWRAGFQTEAEWPDCFSHDLNYREQDAIGDARSNWELNRHFQFALLAKNYAVSGEQRYLDELSALFADWNRGNAFLFGISWTSAMEVAIRSINWCYTLAFLDGTQAPESLREELRVGILNMTDYVARHYSRYSSANNHLVVEAVAIGHSGILFSHKPWLDLSLTILTRELGLQNYSDGVNKELSLHYQSFYMEAMGLMLRLLRVNRLPVPPSWPVMLDKMARFVADCLGNYGEVAAFGDDDAGKIIDLAGVGAQQSAHTWHYRYMLGLMSLLLDTQYTPLARLENETLCRLFSASERRTAEEKPLYVPPQYCCYREGGNTILRSRDRRLLIAIDHAALGYLSICAHAHADALSFQVFYEGKPVLVDPGTSLYHIDGASRDAVRETKNHNTVCVSGQDQSEMLGAFLWGRRASCTLLDAHEENGGFVLTAQHDGYKPVIHTRTFRFDGDRALVIEDSVSGGEAACEASLLLGPGLDAAEQADGSWQSGGLSLRFKGAENVKRESARYYPVYGRGEAIEALRAAFHTGKLSTEIAIR